MNWEAIGAIGEIVGAAGVIASLLYLGIQTKSNARALRANAVWDAETVFAQRGENLARDPHMSELLRRAFADDADISEFTESERFQISADVLSVLQRVQAQYFVWKSGNLPDNIWMPRSKWTRRWIKLPVIGAYWKEFQSTDLLVDEFVAHISSIEEQTVFSMPSGRPSDDA